MDKNLNHFTNDNDSKCITDEFSRLLQDVLPKLYNIAKLKIHNLDDVDDIIQETTINAFYNFKNLKNKNTFPQWIIQILINECNKTYKKKYRQKELFTKIHTLAHAENNISSIDELISTMSFKSLISSFTQKDQDILTLHYECDFSVKDIALIIKLKESSVKSRIYRCRLQLESKYAKYLTKKKRETYSYESENHK